MVDSSNMRLVGHLDMGGEGDCMHVNLKDGHAFVGHMGERGTSIVDVRDPSDPRLVARIPSPANTHGHKVQVVDDVLLVNRERIPRAGSPWVAGLEVYDVSDVTKPRQIAFWQCGGKGVHRMTYWERPLAYVTAGDDRFEEQFLVILDLSEPSRPREVGRWWLPGMRDDERAAWTADRTVKLHHALVRNGRAYCSWWDEGLVILDVTDPSTPTLAGRLRFGDDVSRWTHTTCPIPGRDLLVVTEERISPGCTEFSPHVRLVDIADEQTPRVVSTLPTPEGDYCERGGRFGPHNVHEPRPGSLIDGSTVYVTWFNAGVRVFDISDASTPTEIAWFVPETPPGRPAIQLNDIYVADDGLVYVTDRLAGGLYILEVDGAAASARPRASQRGDA
ncbi:MAG TPA: hypothetical protein VFI28_00945 [Candidatus Limnocylindrales bacterium]|nr:hypothetical protein [Candidatus Limnocylindrales bacterium]